MKNKLNDPFTQFVSIVIAVFFATACTLDTMGCGGDPDALFPDVLLDAQPDVAPEAGPDHKVEASPEAEAGHDAKPEADASTEDAIKPDVEPDVVAEDASPEAEPDVIEAGEDAVAEDSAPEDAPDVVEAGEDVVVDAPEEPPTGVCATQGHDGKTMVHPIVALGPSAYLTVFGMLTYPADAGTASTPFEGWCWSAQGGQGEFDCFPKAGGVEAPAVSGTQVLVQIGTNQAGSGPPNFYLCDFGVCPVTVIFCAGKTEACRWTNGTASGNVAYHEPGHNGKGELTCTLP